MILYVEGNLFQSPAQVWVNTVNTVGVMGKGVALEFKRLFPEMYAQYRLLCEQKQFAIGKLWLYKDRQKWVLNFPTKQHWRMPSRMEYIEAGLEKFVQVYSDWGIHSIAFPPLGCGNGQLSFKNQVKPLMERYLKNLPIDVFIYPQRSSDFVEHLNRAEMEAWLRSEPTSLPFCEVWEDLIRCLAVRKDFYTVNEKQHFTAYIEDEGPHLKIVTNAETYLVHYETLQLLWQQLRQLGFSMPNIAPGLEHELEYLMPIFTELSYVAPVHLADGYEQLSTARIAGLQFVPTAIQRAEGPKSVQLSLFEMG